MFFTWGMVTKMVFNKVLSYLGWGVGSGGCLIKYLEYLLIFRAWDFSFFSSKGSGCGG